MSQPQIDATGASTGSFKTYAMGFVLSVALTIIAFALVMSGTLSRTATLSGMFIAAVAQVMVHLHCFLHLDTSSEARWNILALLFALLIMILFVGGTIWIIHSLNYRLR